MGDLTLRLTPQTLAIERDCAIPSLTECGFAGRWTAPRPAASIRWLIDGCIAELHADDGSVWMSALTLRSADQPIELAGGLGARFRPLA